MQQIYLSLEVLGWPAFVGGSSIIGGTEAKRCYDYWANADRLLGHGDDASYLIDCIANLNRAIDQRLKHLQCCINSKKSLTTDNRKTSCRY